MGYKISEVVGEGAAKPEFLKGTSEVPVYFLFNGLAVYCGTKIAWYLL